MRNINRNNTTNLVINNVNTLCVIIGVMGLNLLWYHKYIISFNLKLKKFEIFFYAYVTQLAEVPGLKSGCWEIVALRKYIVWRSDETG